MPRSKGWRDRRDERVVDEASIGAVLDRLLRRPEFARGHAIGLLLESWSDIVGARVAAETAPFSLDAGVLVVAVTSGTWGAQARFLVDEIRARANRTLGREIVSVVQIVVRPDAVKPLRGKA
ncbi:MAG: hypothetical protein RL325_80 [Planctomycetota bacterium]